MEREKVDRLIENMLTTMKHHGLEAQLGQLGEECSELAIAAHHYQRIISKKTKPSAIIEEQKRNELILEIADVLNVLEQIVRDMNLTETVNNVRYRKMEREVKRIQKESCKGNVSAIVDAGIMMANDYSKLVSSLEGFVRTTKFVHPHSAEALLRDAIDKSRYRISTWRKVLDGNTDN